jgi:rhodanese-related sulfurtransferase
MVINITVEELKAILNKEPDTVIIDVRTPAEFLSGTIAGAININLFDPLFMDNINKLDREGNYMFLCQRGNRSGSAAGCLRQLGYKNVCNIIGGMLAWDGVVEYPKAA